MQNQMVRDGEVAVLSVLSTRVILTNHVDWLRGCTVRMFFRRCVKLLKDDQTLGFDALVLPSNSVIKKDQQHEPSSYAM